METSTDNKIVFGGGSCQLNLGKEVAKIFALTFDEDLSYIDSLKLPNSNMNTETVSEIKRMPDRDVLFVGTKRCLFVVEWTGTHFEILNFIDQLHNCKVSILK